MYTSNEKERIADVIRPMIEGIPFIPPPIDGVSATLVAGAVEGDDCAVVELQGAMDLVVTTDYVRGPKFSLYEFGLLSNYDIGYYLAVANLSDVASMGAIPLGLLTVIRYPSSMSNEEFNVCAQGVADACRVYSTTPIGGDIGSAERVILSATALGLCEVGRSLRRTSAQPGDRLFVSGPVGRAGAAVLYYELRRSGRIQAIAEQLEDDLLEAWRRPRARFDVGRRLSVSGERCSAQDVSDGLKATLEELAATSDVSIELHSKNVPVPLSVLAVAEGLGVDPIALALSASVDFELAFTVPRSASALVAAVEELGCVEIGEVVEGAGCVLRRADGSHADLPGVSWKHQGDDVVVTVLDGLK